MLALAIVLGIGFVVVLIGWAALKVLDPVNWWLHRRCNKLQAQLDVLEAIRPDDARWQAAQQRIPALKEQAAAAFRDCLCHMGFLVSLGNGKYAPAPKCYASETPAAPPAETPAPTPAPRVHPMAAQMALASAMPERIRTQVAEFVEKFSNRLSDFPDDKCLETETLRRVIEQVLDEIPDLEDEAMHQIRKLIDQASELKKRQEAVCQETGAARSETQS